MLGAEGIDVCMCFNINSIQILLKRRSCGNLLHI